VSTQQLRSRIRLQLQATGNLLQIMKLLLVVTVLLVTLEFAPSALAALVLEEEAEAVLQKIRTLVATANCLHENQEETAAQSNPLAQGSPNAYLQQISIERRGKGEKPSISVQHHSNSSCLPVSESLQCLCGNNGQAFPYLLCGHLNFCKTLEYTLDSGYNYVIHMW